MPLMKTKNLEFSYNLFFKIVIMTLLTTLYTLEIGMSPLIRNWTHQDIYILTIMKLVNT